MGVPITGRGFTAALAGERQFTGAVPDIGLSHEGRRDVESDCKVQRVN